MQYMAWAVLFLITVWQLFRVFGGPITEAENPWQLLLRSALFALLVGAARPIFTMALDIARAPYTALMEVSMEAEDFTFAGIEEALKNGLTTIVSTVTVVGPILILILLIALGWNYFKLLLECVERYIVVGVLCYTSPLAFAWAVPKPPTRCSNPGAGWWVPSCCCWCSTCGSSGPLTARWASSSATAGPWPAVTARCSSGCSAPWPFSRPPKSLTATWRPWA